MTLLVYYICWAVIAIIYIPILIVYCIISLIFKGILSLFNSGTSNKTNDYISNYNTNTNEKDLHLVEDNNYDNNSTINNNDLQLVEDNNNINSIN